MKYSKQSITRNVFHVIQSLLALLSIQNIITLLLQHFTQPTFTCLMSPIEETLEKDEEYIQS